MEIYAESQIVEVPSYMHVGYLAATTTRPNDSVSTTGWIMILLGAIIVVAMIKLTKEQKHKLTVMKFRKPYLIPIFGFFFIVGGLLMISASYKVFGKIVYAHPKEMTQMSMEKLATDINISNWVRFDTSIKNTPPTDIGEALKTLQKSKYFSEELYDSRDIWGKTFRLDPVQYEKRILYTLRSAGTDETFDTDDDIVYPEESKYKQFNENVASIYFFDEKYKEETDRLHGIRDEEKNQTQGVDK